MMGHGWIPEVPLMSPPLLIWLPQQLPEFVFSGLQVATVLVV